jgi:hypothetical protein
MTKTQFHKLCATSETRNLSIAVRREYRGFDTCVYLNGIWAGRAILSQELYRPTPGRQLRFDSGSESIAVRDEKLVAARFKFQRWLDEFLAAPFSTPSKGRK